MSAEDFCKDEHLRMWGIQICQYPQLTMRLVVLLWLIENSMVKMKITRKIVRAFVFFRLDVMVFLGVKQVQKNYR